MHPLIVFTFNGCGWLECFADAPDAEHGIPVCPVEPGDKFFDLAAKIDAHIVEHGC